MKTQFIDPFLKQSRRRSSPVIQFSTTARCPREKIFNHMINIVLLLTMEISFLFFIISHPNPWTTVLVNTFESILSWRNRFFFVRKRNTDVGFACSFGLQFHLFWCGVAFHRCPTLSHATQDERGGELLCHARNKGVKLEYDFLRSSLGWEWWPWLSEKCVFVANIWLNRGFLWGYLGKEGRRGKIGNLF